MRLSPTPRSCGLSLKRGLRSASLQRVDPFLDLEAWCASALPGVGLHDHFGPTRAEHLLRFELGAPHENCTQERVDQATDRASTIFEKVFSAEAPIDLVIFDYRAASESTELDLYAALPPGLRFHERILGPSDNRSGELPQRLARLARGSIDHRTIFRAIANTEMGFQPRLAQALSFHGRSTGQCFYMYDDRGCVVAGAPQDALVARFGDWVIQRNPRRRTGR